MSDVMELSELIAEIKNICKNSERSNADVKILAVSKLQPFEKIKNLMEKGQIDFGENYVQEFTEKQKILEGQKVNWHLIGHLQKNKVKFVIGKCELIHSVDSLELAKEISKRATAQSVTQKILLQVNVAGENSKEGFDLSNLMSSINEILQLPHLSVCGLMTMPPFVENPEDNRLFFRKLRELLKEIKVKTNAPEFFKELSMGTSQDYRVAVEEGATWIRLGSTLFGERPTKKS